MTLLKTPTRTVWIPLEDRTSPKVLAMCLPAVLLLMLRKPVGLLLVSPTMLTAVTVRLVLPIT